MMIKVTYVDHDLKEDIVAVPLGHSLMEAAKAPEVTFWERIPAYTWKTSRL